MWIVLWDLLLKFFLNKISMGLVNSAQDPQEKHNPMWNALLKKKKKKNQNVDVA